MLVEVGNFTFPADFLILKIEEDNKVLLILVRPFLHTTDAVIRVKQKQLNLRVGTERMIFNIDSAMKHSYSNDDTCFSIDEILEEDFDALLDKGSKILHFIEGTLLEEEIFSEFDEFMAMTADENSESESDTEEPPFEKITINTDYKIKTSLEEPPTDLELKPLPDNLEYVFLEEPSFLPVIISSQLYAQNKSKLIQLLDDKKPVVQKQRRLNPNMQEVVKKEIVKLLDTSIIYPIADSPWVSPIYCVPKKGGITVVTNGNDELVPTRTVTGWRKDSQEINISVSLMVFLDIFKFLLILWIKKKQHSHVLSEHTVIGECLSGYAMPKLHSKEMHGWQKSCYTTLYEESVEVFMDDFSVFGDYFDKCLNNLDKMLQHCKDAHLDLNWEKCHFMVKEGIVLGHKVFSAGLEVDKAKINIYDRFQEHFTVVSCRCFQLIFPTYQKFSTKIQRQDLLSKYVKTAVSDGFPTETAVSDGFPTENSRRYRPAIVVVLISKVLEAFSDMQFSEVVLTFYLRVLSVACLLSQGGTMTMSLMHQWHDTICGGVIGLRRSLLERMDAIPDTLFRSSSGLSIGALDHLFQLVGNSLIIPYPIHMSRDPFRSYPSFYYCIYYISFTEH
ncbi:hypothetical protein Tco_1164579 [Tanacetum coccineum]